MPLRPKRRRCACLEIRMHVRKKRWKSFFLSDCMERKTHAVIYSQRNRWRWRWDRRNPSWRLDSQVLSNENRGQVCRNVSSSRGPFLRGKYVAFLILLHQCRARNTWFGLCIARNLCFVHRLCSQRSLLRIGNAHSMWTVYTRSRFLDWTSRKVIQAAIERVNVKSSKQLTQLSKHLSISI